MKEDKQTAQQKEKGAMDAENSITFKGAVDH